MEIKILITSSNQFPTLSEAKVKEGTFVGPQIRALTKSKMCEESVTCAERQGWIYFEEVIDKFLGNNKYTSY
jgi:hypothetical protein